MSLDRTVDSKRHTVSLNLQITPATATSDDSSHGKPSVHFDLASQRPEEQLSEGFTKAELLEAMRMGVDSACLQGKKLKSQKAWNIALSPLHLS